MVVIYVIWDSMNETEVKELKYRPSHTTVMESHKELTVAPTSDRV
jgi:hypothetical protein